MIIGIGPFHIVSALPILSITTALAAKKLPIQVKDRKKPSTIPVNIAQAALGTELEVPTLEEPYKLKIPEGTQSGKELRIRGRGVPFLNEKGHGDLVVKVLVQVPRKLSRSQREVVQKLAELMNVDNKPTSATLLDKMKDLFN